MNKQLIAQRFTKALADYNADAIVQRKIALRMVELLNPYTASPLSRVAEFGCGTGYYTQLLREAYYPAQLFLNDLCTEAGIPFLKLNDPQIHFTGGDAEQWEMPTELDLVTGCSVVQWFEHPNAFFAKCHQALRPGGIIAFTSFAPATYQEIRTLTGQGLSYLTQAEYTAQLEAQGYEILHAESEPHTLTFESATRVLRHLKATGVTGTAPFVWTRGRLAQFEADYHAQFATPKGLPLTYQPIYIIAQKQSHTLIQ